MRDIWIRARAIALDNPCLLAEETAHPRFGTLIRDGSVVVTVNSGYE